MKYLRLIFFDENACHTLSDDDVLRSIQVTTTMRVRRSRVSVTDGPFAETNG